MVAVHPQIWLVALLMFRHPRRTALLYFCAISVDRVRLQVILSEIVLKVLPITPLEYLLPGLLSNYMEGSQQRFLLGFPYVLQISTSLPIPYYHR